MIRRRALLAGAAAPLVARQAAASSFQKGAELDAYIAQDFQRAEALLSLARVEPE